MHWPLICKYFLLMLFYDPQNKILLTKIMKLVFYTYIEFIILILYL